MFIVKGDIVQVDIVKSWVTGEDIQLQKVA